MAQGPEEEYIPQAALTLSSSKGLHQPHHGTHDQIWSFAIWIWERGLLIWDVGFSTSDMVLVQII